jgi:hypothetical protein
MAERHRTLKYLFDDLAGLRFPSGTLFESYGDSLLLVSRMTGVHASRDPYFALDKDMVHDKCLEILDNCHEKRDMLLWSTRMNDRFWEEIRLTTPWTENVPAYILRTFTLHIVQAAWAHVQNPKLDSREEPRPYCELAIAALRFATDIFKYEAYMWDQSDNFVAFRGPTHFGNGKPVVGRDGNTVTQPIFPISSLVGGKKLRPLGHSHIYEATREDPERINNLPRV